MKRTRLPAAVLVVVAAGLDQLSKLWALRALADGPIDILPTVQFDLYRNDGASFSAGAGSGRIIGILVVVAITGLLWMMRKAESRRNVLILAVVVGGAIGNLIDRLFRAEDGLLTGHVVDFIDVSWFAVFNVADSFVVVGMILLILLEWLDGRRREDTESPTADQSVTATADRHET